MKTTQTKASQTHNARCRNIKATRLAYMFDDAQMELFGLLGESSCDDFAIGVCDPDGPYTATPVARAARAEIVVGDGCPGYLTSFGVSGQVLTVHVFGYQIVSGQRMYRVMRVDTMRKLPGLRSATELRPLI